MDDKELFKQIEKDFTMLDYDTIYNIDGIKFSFKFANQKNEPRHISLFAYNAGTGALYVNDLFLPSYVQKAIKINSDLIILNIKNYLVNKYKINPSHSKKCRLVFNYFKESTEINIYNF